MRQSIRNNTAMLSMAMAAAVASVFTFTGKVVGGGLGVVSDTVESGYKTINLGNQSIHKAADRKLVQQEVTDRIKRGNLKLDIAQASLDYVQREDELFAQFGDISPDLRDKVIARAEAFPDVEPYTSVSSMETS